MRGTLSRPLRLGVAILSFALTLAPHAFAETTYGAPRLLPFSNLLFPVGLTVDRNGYVIVADGIWRNFVVDLSPDGVQRTIRPYWYDDSNQRDVAVDADNNLYVTTAQGLFRTPPDRVSSTTQLKPFPAYAPFRTALDGLGNIYAIDGGNYRVLKVDLATLGATSVAFPPLLAGAAGGGPDGLAADSAGNVFVSDTNNNRVLEWSPGGVGVRTLLDATTVSLPRGLTLDAAGNLYIADSGNGRVLRRTPDGTVTTLPFPGLGTWSGSYQGDVGGVISVAVDATGSVYALDRGPGHVWEISPVSPQSITFTSTAPGDAAVGGTYVVAATGGGSGNLVMFSIDAASAGACTISGATVSFAHTGTCVIDANQAGSATYAAAPQAQQSFSIGKGTPTVTWNHPAAIVYGTRLDSTQLNATASVAGSFAYTPVAGTILAAGTQALSVQFTPTDAANWNGTSATTSIDVSKAPQTIAFTSDPTGAAVGRTYVAAASGGGSGNAVVLSLDPSTTAGACTLAGSVVTYVTVGTCVIDANEAGDTNYLPASQVQQTVPIAKGTPGFAWARPAAINFGTPLDAAQLNATASIAGSFVYTPPAGTVLQPGAGQTLMVTFTPADAANWNGVSATTTIDVNTTQPPITTTQTGPVDVPAGGSAAIIGGSVTGTVTVAPGASLYVGSGASVNGVVSVAPGATIVVNNATINGPVRAVADTNLTLCGATITAPITVTGSAGVLRIGATSDCAGNTIIASVTLTSNTGGVSFVGNNVTGKVTIQGNSGGFVFSGNTINGPTIVSSNN